MFCRISPLQCKGETRVKAMLKLHISKRGECRVKNVVTLLVEDGHYCHLRQYRITYELNVNNVTAVWHNASTGRVFFDTMSHTGSYTLHYYIFEAVVNSFVYFKAWRETSGAVIFVLYEGITYLFYVNVWIFLFWIASIKDR